LLSATLAGSLTATGNVGFDAGDAGAFAAAHNIGGQVMIANDRT